MDGMYNMKRIITIINKKDETRSNLDFWANSNNEDKISAIQILREQYITLFNKQQEYDESRKRLRRIYTVVKQTQS